MLSISATLSGVISHARLFLLASCGTLGRRSRNPWVPRNPGWKSLDHMLAWKTLSMQIMHRPINAGMTPSVRLYGREEGGRQPKGIHSKQRCLYTAAHPACFYVSCSSSADQRCADPKIWSPHQSAILTKNASPRTQQEQNIGSTVSPRRHWIGLFCKEGH